jgi:ABC-type lipoprotein export system ATPase subunit
VSLQSLRLHAIKKTYNQADKINTIFSNVSFLFQKGTSYAITGSSGAGKSTLLHILAGLDYPTSGTVYFNDEDYTKLALAQKEYYSNHFFGFMFQNPYLINELTVLENVMVKGLITGMAYKECVRFAYTLLEEIGIEDKAHNLPATLSGGQQQRVALARALLGKPDFLCADEPTGNLDKTTGLQIFKLLKYYQEQWGMGIIMSTHDQTVFEQMDVILKLEDCSLKVERNFCLTRQQE